MSSTSLYQRVVRISKSCCSPNLTYLMMKIRIVKSVTYLWKWSKVMKSWKLRSVLQVERLRSSVVKWCRTCWCCCTNSSVHLSTLMKMNLDHMTLLPSWTWTSHLVKHMSAICERAPKWWKRVSRVCWLWSLQKLQLSWWDVDLNPSNTQTRKFNNKTNTDLLVICGKHRL